MSSSPYRRKIHEITYRYGAAAAEYFASQSGCEDCNEERIACLNVHHVNGRAHDVFRVLCFNCHMVEHHGSSTVSDERDRVKAKRVAREERDALIRELSEQNLSSRQVGAIVGVSYVTVCSVLKA